MTDSVTKEYLICFYLLWFILADIGEKEVGFTDNKVNGHYSYNKRPHSPTILEPFHSYLGDNILHNLI